MLGVLRHRAAAVGTPAEFGRLKTGLRDFLRCAVRSGRIVAEQLRGVSCLWKGPAITQQSPHWLVQLFAQQIPERNINAGKRVIGLEQIKALRPRQRVDAPNVLRAFQSLTQNGRADWLAGAVRHWAVPTGNRNKRGSFAFTPANAVTGPDTH